MKTYDNILLNRNIFEWFLPIFWVDFIIPNVPLKMEARYYRFISLKRKCAKIVQTHTPNHKIFTAALNIFSTNSR